MTNLPGRQFAQWQKTKENIDPQELIAFFDNLDTVPLDDLWGNWEGGLLPTGHPGEIQLTGLNWAGKRFVSPNEVYPIMVFDEEGNVSASDLLGQACVREVNYRGKVSATMIYDNHPTYDYFRRVDANTIMGIMDRKEDTQLLFFYLTNE